MSQLYVPEKAFLVCTDGMKKSQLKVTSQSTTRIADGRLAATENDRFQGNFMCAKMVIAGAIIGAIAAAIVVAAIILSGGTVGIGLAMAIGAAGAAGGAAQGAVASMMPSICSILCMGSQWLPVHDKVLIQKQKALLEHSKINCFLGGNVMIFYSEAAAEEFSDLIMQNTAVKVGGIILGSALACSAVSTVLPAISTFLGNTSFVLNNFGRVAALKYFGEGAVWLGAGYGASKGIDEGKGWVYEQVQENSSFEMADYSDGKTVESIDNITQSNPIGIPEFEETDPVADAASIMHKDENGQIVRDYDPKTSNYELWQHEQEAGLYTRDANISESNSDYYDTRDQRAIQELDPQVLTDNPNPTLISDHSGTYVDRVNSRYETGRQLHMTNLSDLKARVGSTIGNALPSPLEWAIDAYNIAMNALLKVPIEDYKKSLEEELKSKKGITVVEHKI